MTSLEELKYLEQKEQAAWDALQGEPLEVWERARQDVDAFKKEQEHD